ncbi:hypothetical protein ACSMXM_05420 [Pacificimonas sp. ICDLI1SI03]
MIMENLNTEIRRFIAEKIKAGATVHPQFLTTEILNQRQNDMEWLRACARSKVQETMKRCIGKYAASEGWNDRQFTMEGFEHLQIAYSVPRGRENVLVPVDQLSDEELLTRAHEYRDMATGCVDHAKEIEGYVKRRKTEEAA